MRGRFGIVGRLDGDNPGSFGFVDGNWQSWAHAQHRSVTRCGLPAYRAFMSWCCVPGQGSGKVVFLI